MSRTEDVLVRRTRRIVLGVVALLACALIGSVVGWRWHLSYEVNGRLRALQRAGLPTSGAELNQWYASVPDAENAALVLTQAFALMRTFPDQRSNEISRFKPPARRQPLTPEEKVLLAEYVALNAEALAKAREAIKLPKSRYPEQELEANRHYYLLSNLLLPSVDRILIREGECAAWMIMAQTALALERFRLKQERLPKDLNALVPDFLPAVPLDPFDGAALRYKPLPTGYMVYSIGTDGHDDGGKEPPVRRRGTEHVPEDITMTVER